MQVAHSFSSGNNLSTSRTFSRRGVSANPLGTRKLVAATALILVLFAIILLLVSLQRSSNASVLKAKSAAQTTKIGALAAAVSNQASKLAATNTNTGNSQSSTTVTVNGKTVSVPNNGSYNQTSEQGGTTSNISIHSSDNSTSDSNQASNTSSTNIAVGSH